MAKKISLMPYGQPHTRRPKLDQIDIIRATKRPKTFAHTHDMSSLFEKKSCANFVNTLSLPSPPDQLDEMVLGIYDLKSLGFYLCLSFLFYVNNSSE